MGMWDLNGNMAQIFCIPKNQYTEDKIPSLQGKVIIVTGGNSGIGLQTCRVLLRKGAKVYLAARSPTRAQTAIETLYAENPEARREGRLQYLELDLGDVKKARDAAGEFKRREQRLDVLFNSAGVMMPPPEEKTADGYDLQLGTNVLGHFAFTTSLVPLLVQTAKATGKFTRVITTSSSGHMYAPKQGVDFDNINLDGETTLVKYGQSKLGNVYIADELARRYGAQGVFSCSVHPGLVNTDLQRHMSKPSAWIFRKTIANPVELGAVTQLYAGTSPDVTMEDAKTYYIPWARKADTNHPAGRDGRAAERLWGWCEEQVGKITGERAVPV